MHINDKFSSVSANAQPTTNPQPPSQGAQSATEPLSSFMEHALNTDWHSGAHLPFIGIQWDLYKVSQTKLNGMAKVQKWGFGKSDSILNSLPCFLSDLDLSAWRMFTLARVAARQTCWN